MVTNWLTTVVMVVVVTLLKAEELGTGTTLEVVILRVLDEVRVEARVETEVGLGMEVDGMVETGGGTGRTEDEELCVAPRPARPKTAKIVENFIFNAGSLWIVDDRDFLC